MERWVRQTLRWNKIQEYLKSHDYIMNAGVRELCEVSAATANRILLNALTQQEPPARLGRVKKL